MTGRFRCSLLYLPVVLLCTINFTISSEVWAKPKLERTSGNGRALGRLRNLQENTPPTITGTPDDTVLENTFYDFVPSATDRDGDSLTYSIANKPGWSDFDPTSGALYGTPSGADVGHYSSIQIAVSDGHTTAELAAFSIDVTSTADASVTLQWQPPTENTDGTPLINLAAYRIYYGADAAELNNVIELPNPGVTTYVVEELTPDTWYFAMTAIDDQGRESVFSNQQVSDAR